MKRVITIYALFLAGALWPLPALASVYGQLILGVSGEYRFINIYGQENGVPSYRGITTVPELQYVIRSKNFGVRFYGNHGFGRLPNTANSELLRENFMYRTFSGGGALHFGGFWIRAGIVYHNSRDEVEGSVTRVVKFKGSGFELGTGFVANISSSIEFVLGMNLQAAKFSRDSSLYLNGRRDYVSYTGFAGINFIIPSTAISDDY